MKTTLVLQDDVIEEAARLSGIATKTALIHAGLHALIEKCARERLAHLGGSQPELTVPRRRRP